MMGALFKDIYGDAWTIVPVRADAKMTEAAANYAKRQVKISGENDFKALAWDICAGHREMIAAKPAFSPGQDLLEKAARGICRQRVEQNLHLDGKSATDDEMKAYLDAGWRNCIEEARYALGEIFGVMPQSPAKTAR